MKKIFCEILLVVLAFMGPETVAQAETSPKDVVTINYSGTVVIPPCTIATPSVTVDFGDIHAADLATSDSATDWKNAVVSLTDCTEVSRYSMTVSASQSAAAPSYIANAGTAEHVAVEAKAYLLSDVPIYNGVVIFGSLTGESAVNTIFQFRIHNDGTGEATTGTVVSTITLTYSFN